jgi:hypothetical protein
LSDIERAIGAGIVREGMPGGWAADALASALGPVFGAFVGAAAFDLGVRDDAEGWAGFLAALVGPAGALPFASPLALSLPASEGVLTGELAPLARQLSQFLGVPLMEPGEEEDKPETPGGGGPPEDLQALVQDVFATGGGPISQEDQSRATELRSLLQALQNAGSERVVGAGSLYGAQRVGDALRAIAGWIARFIPELARFEQWVELELIELAKRAAIAQAIATATNRLPFSLQSNLQIGSYVHRRLQRRYVQWLAGRHDIAIEKWSPVRSQEEQVVIGPGTGGSYVALRDMAKARLDPDGFWRTLRVAMNGVKFTSKRDSWLRADLVDRRLASIWEIKPVKRGPTGVWQEAYYRVTFNLVRPIFHIRRADQPLAIPGLRSGGFLIDASSPRRGVAAGAFTVLNPIDVTRQAKEPAVAIPFQVSILPGLVLYIVVRGPNLRDLLKILIVLVAAAFEQASKFLDDLAQSIRQGLEDAIEQARKLLDAIGDALQPVLQALAVLLALAGLLLVILLGGSGAGFQPQPITPGLLLTPGVAPGGGSDLHARRVPRSLQGTTVASVTHEAGRLSVNLAAKNTRGRGAAPTASFHTAYVDVHGIPEDAMADFSGFYFGVVDDLMKLASVRLARQLEAGRERVV